MAITLFHKVVNKVVIINKDEKKEPINKAVTIKGSVRVNRHTMTEVKTYD